jgi:hypothetical protein
MPVFAKGVDEKLVASAEAPWTESLILLRGVCHRRAAKEVIYRGQVDLVQPVKATWRYFGLDLSSFVPTVWELIPYSFLVDYFANIDDIISAATLNRSTIRWLAKTEVQILQAEFSSFNLAAFPSNLGSSSGYVIMPGHAISKRVIVNRAAYTGSLVPTLEFTIPGFGTKWINMAALRLSHLKMVPFYR